MVQEIEDAADRKSGQSENRQLARIEKKIEAINAKLDRVYGFVRIVRGLMIALMVIWLVSMLLGLLAEFTGWHW